MKGRSLSNLIGVMLIWAMPAPAFAGGGPAHADPSFGALLALGAFGLVIGMLGARHRPTD